MDLKTSLETTLKRIKDYFYPPERSIYVVKEGTFKGEWLVPVSYTPGHTVFFSLPDKHVRTVPNTEVASGLQNKILEIVDVLPKGVYNTCLEEYKLKLKQDDNTPDRRQQYPSPGLLGGKQHRKASSKLKRD
jgi:hypothetical protein